MVSPRERAEPAGWRANKAEDGKKERRSRREKRRTRLQPEKQACRRRGHPTAVKTGLHFRQTERGCKGLWDAEHFDRHLVRGWDAPGQSDSLCPGKARMRSLRGRG